MTTNQQLELGLKGNQRGAQTRQPEERMARGAWWFNQMRQSVANAIDWQALGQTPGQPSWLPGSQSK